MDRKLLKEWFHEEFVPFFIKVSKENDITSRAVLFFDNAPSHPDTQELQTLHRCYSLWTQNVLQSLQLKYRKQFMQHMIDNDATYSFDWKKTTLKMLFLLGRWILKERYSLHVTKVFDKSMANPCITRQRHRKLWRRSAAASADDSWLRANEWMAAYSESSENLTDDDIVAAVT